MDSHVTDQEIAMTLLSRLPEKFGHLIVAIDAVVDYGTLKTEVVKSRLLQKEQKMAERVLFFRKTIWNWLKVRAR